MNVKILACTAIATSLLFTACVKKEEPKETEKQQTPKSSVVNQIPKDQQVQLPTDNNVNGNNTTTPVPANSTDNNANTNNAVDLQASPGPSDTPAAPVRPVEKPRPAAQAEPRKPVQTTQATETKAEKKPVAENSNNTNVQDDTVAGKTERVQAPAKSETPRATPAPITEKADQAQSVDDAIKQAIDAATPAK